MPLNPPKALVEGVLIGNTNQTLYTGPDNTNTLLTHASVHNTDSVARVLTVWIGGSASDATKRFRRAIEPNDTLDLDGVLGKIVPAASLVIAVCDVANKVSVSLSGTAFATS